MTDQQRTRQNKYYDRNSHRRRMPGSFLSEEDAMLLDAMARTYGSATNALLAGLHLLADRTQERPEYMTQKKAGSAHAG